MQEGHHKIKLIILFLFIVINGKSQCCIDFTIPKKECKLLIQAKKAIDKSKYEQAHQLISEYGNEDIYKTITLSYLWYNKNEMQKAIDVVDVALNKNTNILKEKSVLLLLAGDLNLIGKSDTIIAFSYYRKLIVNDTSNSIPYERILNMMQGTSNFDSIQNISELAYKNLQQPIYLLWLADNMLNMENMENANMYIKMFEERESLRDYKYYSVKSKYFYFIWIEDRDIISIENALNFNELAIKMKGYNDFEYQELQYLQKEIISNMPN